MGPQCAEALEARLLEGALGHLGAPAAGELPADALPIMANPARPPGGGSWRPRAGRRAAAGAARPRRLTRARSRPTDALSLAAGSTVAPAPPAPAPDTLPAPPATRYRAAAPTEGASRTGGARGTGDGETCLAFPFMKWLTLSSALLSFSSCRSFESTSRVSRGSSSFYSRSHWRASSPAHVGSRGVGAPSTLRASCGGPGDAPRSPTRRTWRVPRLMIVRRRPGYAATAPGLGVSLARAGWYRVPSRSSA